MALEPGRGIDFKLMCSAGSSCFPGPRVSASSSVQPHIKITAQALAGQLSWLEVVPICQGACRVDPRSGHIQESTNEYLNKQNNSMFLSDPHPQDQLKNKITAKYPVATKYTGRSKVLFFYFQEGKTTQSFLQIGCEDITFIFLQTFCPIWPLNINSKRKILAI